VENAGDLVLVAVGGRFGAGDEVFFAGGATVAGKSAGESADGDFV